MTSIRKVAVLASLLMVSGCAGATGGGADGGSGGGTDGGTGTVASLTVNWTFGSKSCDLANVGTIEIQGTGEADGNAFDKTVSCAKFASGIQIGSLHVEKYDVMVTGYDAAGTVPLYQLASPKVLAIQAGANTFEIDVPSDVGGLEIAWGKFGTYADCGSASVDTIKVSLKDAKGQTVGTKSQACGNVTKVTWQNLPAGTYTAHLEGWFNGDYAAGFAASAQVVVKAGKTQTYTVDLPDNTGTFIIQWTINGSATCGSVTTVTVDVFSPQGEIVPLVDYPCADGGETFANMEAATYTVALYVNDASGKTLYQGTNYNVKVTQGGTATYVIDMK